MEEKREWKPWQKALVLYASGLIVASFLTNGLVNFIQMIGKSK